MDLQWLAFISVDFAWNFTGWYLSQSDLPDTVNYPVFVSWWWTIFPSLPSARSHKYQPKVVVCDDLPAVGDWVQPSEEDRPLPDVPAPHPAGGVAVQGGGEDGPVTQDGSEPGLGGVVVQGHTLHLPLQLDWTRFQILLWNVEIVSVSWFGLVWFKLRLGLHPSKCH